MTGDKHDKWYFYHLKVNTHSFYCIYSIHSSILIFDSIFCRWRHINLMSVSKWKTKKKIVINRNSATQTIWMYASKRHKHNQVTSNSISNSQMYWVVSEMRKKKKRVQICRYVSCFCSPRANNALGSRYLHQQIAIETTKK